MPDDPELPLDPLGLEAVDRAIRLNEDGAGASEDCPPEIQEQFLANVMAFESAPLSSRFEQLSAAGIDLSAPNSLDDDALHAKLWEIIHALAERDAFLSHTDHLSDRELYAHLWSDTLREQNAIFPPGSGWINHIDMIGGCSDEDIQIGLRYYDTEEQRQEWARDFPDAVIPPHEEPPYDRDRLLPQSQFDQEPDEDD